MDVLKTKDSWCSCLWISSLCESIYLCHILWYIGYPTIDQMGGSVAPQLQQQWQIAYHMTLVLYRFHWRILISPIQTVSDLKYFQVSDQTYHSCISSLNSTLHSINTTSCTPHLRPVRHMEYFQVPNERKAALCVTLYFGSGASNFNYSCLYFVIVRVGSGASKSILSCLVVMFKEIDQFDWSG